MKLIVAVINKVDAAGVTAALNRQGISSTRLSTTGGFLRAGNTTLLIGVEEEKVDETLSVLEQHCSRRTRVVNPVDPAVSAQMLTSHPVEVHVGGATVFLLDVERFIKM